jgi:hypothetical protein
MARFEIQPVSSRDLPDAAVFLHRRGGDWGKDAGLLPAPADPVAIERRLRWLLLENPLAPERSTHGFCIRDRSGAIRGLTICFPVAFLAGEGRILSSCSGNYFVDPPARTLGFYLFRKYLNLPGYSFFFTTSCTAASAVLWKEMNGAAGPNSEIDYIVPLKLDNLFAAIMKSRGGDWTSTIIRSLGRCGNRVLRASGSSRPLKLAVEPCRDWKKLSDLFYRHRPKHWVLADRSPEILEWRYTWNSDPEPAGTYLFRDSVGNEGWFSLGYTLRGPGGRIRALALLDAVWPRGKMSFEEIFPAILQLASQSADLIHFRHRPGIDYRACSRWIFLRRWKAPLVSVISRGADARAIAFSLDLAGADGDNALPISVRGLRELADRPAAALAVGETTRL